MLFVLPATSAIRPASYLVPQSYEYLPSQDYYPYHAPLRFAAPSYPSQLDFFRKPSAEELEEHEYRRALEVVANHRRRQAEKEAAIRRQQLARAARQQYFAALTAELEQRRQEELLAARRAELIRSRRARAGLIAAGRQHALDAFLRQLKGAQPVCHVCGTVVVHSILTRSSQINCQPYVVKREPLVDALKQRLAADPDADITEPMQNILSSLESRPAQSGGSEDSGDDAAKLIENLLSSIFPGAMFHARSQSTPSTEQAKPHVSDKGKGKARAVDSEAPQKPAQTKPESAEEAFADIVRHVMEMSKGTPARRSPDEAGPSGSPPSRSAAQPAVTEREQAQIDRAIALSSVEHLQNTLTKLQTNFVLPTELDHYAASTDDRDETATISSVSSSDLTKLIPYTNTNKPVYKYENELSGLLGELDEIDSHGDGEVREKRRVVVKAVEEALKGVERVVSEAVEKRLSLISVEGPLKGFDVDEDVTEEASPGPDQVETPVVVDELTVSKPFTPNQMEERVVPSAGGSSPGDEALHESKAPVVSETTSDLPVEPTSIESDVEASTATITPGFFEPASVTEPEPAQSQVQVGAREIVDTFLLPERVSPASPAKGRRGIDVDTDDEILVLGSDSEKSDWSELEER